jgi:23S rRNA (pseudouridine1915-N3)-methyltransferase
MIAFPKIRLITVGKVKKAWIYEGVAVYQKRLPELDVIEVKDSTPEKEGDQILTLLKGRDRLIALTEEGQLFSSRQFAAMLAAAESHNWVFAIGGAVGLSAAVKDRAASLLSLSPMTFPHEIARLLFTEQLYRAKSILQGTSYQK